MRELAQAIPDPETVLALAPEELGAKLLFLLREREERDRGSINPHNHLMEVRSARPMNRIHTPKNVETRFLSR